MCTKSLLQYNKQIMTEVNGAMSEDEKDSGHHKDCLQAHDAK